MLKFPFANKKMAAILPYIVYGFLTAQIQGSDAQRVYQAESYLKSLLDETKALSQNKHEKCTITGNSYRQY